MMCHGLKYLVDVKKASSVTAESSGACQWLFRWAELDLSVDRALYCQFAFDTS